MSHDAREADANLAEIARLQAACAAQILAARLYLAAMRNTGHNAYQVAARTQLEQSIDSNAGKLLLGQLERLRTIVEWYADVSNYDSFNAPGTLDMQAGTWHVDGGERARAALERKARET